MWAFMPANANCSGCTARSPRRSNSGDQAFDGAGAAQAAK